MTGLAFYAWYLTPVLALGFCTVVYLLAASGTNRAPAKLNEDQAPAE
jgi:hypothetical protein